MFWRGFIEIVYYKFRTVINRNKDHERKTINMNVERVKERIKRYLRYMNGSYREDDEETKSYLERIEKSRRGCGGLGWQYVADMDPCNLDKFSLSFEENDMLIPPHLFLNPLFLEHSVLLYPALKLLRSQIVQ